MFPEGVVLMMVRIADPAASQTKNNSAFAVIPHPQLKKRSKDEGMNTGYFHETLSHMLVWEGEG